MFTRGDSRKVGYRFCLRLESSRTAGGHAGLAGRARGVARLRKQGCGDRSITVAGLGCLLLLLALVLAVAGCKASAANPAPAKAPANRVLPAAPTQSPATGNAAQQHPNQLPTLTTAEAVHNLLPSQAKLHYPVHLRAICIVCIPGWYGFFANDGVTGVYIQTRNQTPLTAAIQPGTWLEIDGVTSAGEYAPIVDQSDLRILGKGPLPPPRPVSLDILSSGAEDGQWISFEGTVRSATMRESLVSLVVASGRLQIEVMTLPSAKEFSHLVHARVRVSGTPGPIFNRRRQLIGVNVYSPSMDSIHVLQPAPTDPFSLPLKQVKAVFEYAPGAIPDQLVRIRGVVTARRGETVFLTDGIQGAGVQSSERSSLQPGEMVDAVGYPVLDGEANTIDDAIFKRLGTAPLPEPKSIGAKQALSGDFEGDLVRLNGRLIAHEQTADQFTLLVDAGGTVFSAILPGSFREQEFATLRDGSQVELTGICVISETQASRHFRLPKAFEILLRSTSDVVVTQTPSLWTPYHALLVLLFALAGTAVVLAWGMALRRRVEQQTDLLRQQALLLRESEQRFRYMAQHDALTGLASRLVFQDRLNQALETARRYRKGLTLLMLDLDRFKDINDTAGHAAGDEVLLVTANRIVEAVRKSDTVARMGGDEFMVLLPDLSDRLSAESIAEKLVATLSAPIPFAGHELLVSVSIGVCTAHGEGLDAEALQKNVDAALYRAKARGRNCFAI